MTVFLDTSGLYAVFDRDDDNHEAAGRDWEALLAAGKRRLSLTDCVSFEMMRRTGCGRAFAFDPHFNQQGFMTRWI